jgi:hypothetical protein
MQSDRVPGARPQSPAPVVVPVIVLVPTSVAVMVSGPAVISVLRLVKVCTPLSAATNV